MPPRVNLHDPDETIRWLVQQIESLQHKVTASYTSITRGALRVASAEGLIVDGSARVNGTLIITGEQQMDGELRVTGTLLVSGDTTINGGTTINGPTSITGEFTIDGNTTITGQVEVTGDVLVTGDGKITVDGSNPITLEVDGAGRASINFSTGYIVGDADGITVYSNSGQALYLNENGVRFAALATVTGVGPNLHADTLGYVKRVV